jgi:hypothetical protein
VFGLICALIADSKGRSGVGWFFIGFFFSIIALVLVLVVSDLKTINNRHRDLQIDNRRLRERLRKDRQTSDQRHVETVARLGHHDRALGVDTANLTSAKPAHQGLAPPPVPLTSPDPMREKKWFFVLDGASQGPMGFYELQQAFDRGQLQPETLLWNNEMSDWSPLCDLRDLQESLLA